MKTTNQPHATQVVLKDGSSHLATWQQRFDVAPTVGDRVDISGQLSSESFQGYRPYASVSRVCVTAASGPLIELEAECEEGNGRRPVVLLNASLIPEKDRHAVEQAVREAVRHPRISWEESFRTEAVLHFHTWGRTDQAAQQSLASSIDRILRKSLEPSPL